MVEEMKQTLVVSFSGGKTSGFMCKWLINNFGHLYDFVFLFSNTGREHEKTLEFVNRCDTEFGLNLVWLEAVVNPEHGKGIRHRVVNYQTASRNGEPFEAFIAKSGIPNASYPQCSDRLKTFVIESYKRDNGLTGCLHALGMRADEPKRINPQSKAVKRYNLVYPLAQWGSFDKQDVNDWWEEQSFNLEIPPHHGNCVTCWKKTDSKLFRIAHEHPEWFTWDIEMERKYQDVKPNSNGVPRVFFRKNRSAIDILKAAKVTDISMLIHVTETDQDIPGGCGESCEAYQLDDDEYSGTGLTVTTP